MREVYATETAVVAGVMLGQNEPALVGMPELGVTLTGTAEHPEVVNNSGRGILGYVIVSLEANGHGSLMPILKTHELRMALLKPAPASGPMATPPRSSFDNGGPTVQAILDAVIFDNGEFVGSDPWQYFVILSGQIDGERTLAQDILAGRVSWEQLDAQRLPSSLLIEKASVRGSGLRRAASVGPGVSDEG
jgi:hypothetical protein